jgi:hypothetical protein
MYHRSMWAVAKTFAVGKDKALFKKLRKEFDVKRSMKIMVKDKNKLVSISSRLYLISPSLYFKVVGLKK